ncbi:MAG: cation:proton antiporter, partial [Planctomycetota bacterium]
MDKHELLFAVATVIFLGVGVQWLSWRLRIPSILLLLLMGFVAGPVTGFVRPDEQFGEILLPFVSLSVALILYEGGLSLRFGELGKSGPVVWKLVSIGALVTWIVAGLGAWWLLGLSVELAVLLGAILVVTGPTVIGPILQQLRPAGPVGPVLKWEGIVIDPIGAMLAVLVFEVILLAGSPEQATQAAVTSALTAVALGGVLGILAGLLLAAMIKRFWIPDYLQNAVSLMLVIGVYTVAEGFQAEAGLFAATVMGMTLANQRFADVRHIVEFKENLRVLLISALFIVLAARLRPEDFEGMRWGNVAAFFAVLVLVARPLSVACSTVRSTLSRLDRVFLGWMAPRGIVAAAVSSVFALRLQEAGHQEAGVLVPLTFVTIIGTVVLYGLTGPLVARRAGIAEPNPQGVLFVGAHAWCRLVAATLQRQGFRVLLVDTNRGNLAAARMEHLPTYAGSILAEHAMDELDLGGMGKLIAATPNDWVNVLAVQRLSRVFGRGEVYQTAPARGDEKTQAAHRHLHGRWLFAQGITFSELARRIERGDVVKATPITEAFTAESFV